MHTGILLCVVDCSKINSNWKQNERRWRQARREARKPWENTKDVRKNVKHSTTVNQTHINFFLFFLPFPCLDRVTVCVMNELCRVSRLKCHMPAYELAFGRREKRGFELDFLFLLLLSPFFFFALIIFNLDDSCVWSVWIIISTLTYNFIWERENVPYELMMIAWRNFIQFILEF